MLGITEIFKNLDILFKLIVADIRKIKGKFSSFLYFHFTSLIIFFNFKKKKLVLSFQNFFCIKMCRMITRTIKEKLDRYVERQGFTIDTHHKDISN